LLRRHGSHAPIYFHVPNPVAKDLADDELFGQL